MNSLTSPARGRLRAMRADDLDTVMAIENRGYAFPWSRGIFADCLKSGYAAWLLEHDGQAIGYGVLSVAADEAHVLNVCVDPLVQSRGHGRLLLRSLLDSARRQGAHRVFLEVRPSNLSAIALYHSEGFHEIGRRPRYYPAPNNGREDAIVMAIELLDDEITTMPPL